MKRVLLMSVLLCMVLMQTQLFAQTRRVTFVCEDKEDFPHVMGNATEVMWPRPGAAVEAVKTLEAALGITVDIRRVPWKRALDIELKGNKADGVFLVSYLKEREAVGVFPMAQGKPDSSRSLFSDDYVFYKLRASPIEWDGHRLKGLSAKGVGANRGYSIVYDLKARGYPVTESDSTPENMKRLTSGMVDAIAALQMQGDSCLKKDPGSDTVVQKLSPPIVSKEYFLMLSHEFVRKNPELSRKIWDAIGAMKGKPYSMIMEKYLE